MKVYIGKPDRWISSYSLTKHLERWIGEDGCDIIDSAFQPIINFVWNDRWWSKQRSSIRIDYYDTWSADWTLARVIVPVLIKLKADKHGTPYVDDADVPDHLKSTAAEPLTEYQKNTGHVDSLHEARWDWVLDEMIWAFSQELVEHNGGGWEHQYYSGELDIKFVKNVDNEYYKLTDGPNHTFKVDQAGIQVHQERMKQGRILFAKYYNCLWD